MSDKHPAPKPALPPFIAEHAPRPARVHEPADWPWPGEPWPWCPLASHQAHDRVTGGAITRPAVPHDAHVVNEGNTVCPGAAGTLPATPARVHRANLVEAERHVEKAKGRLADARAMLNVAERARDRQQALVTYAEGLTDG